MSASKVALILGAGANVGQHVARAFAAKGYKIALVARSVPESDIKDGYLNIKADFANPSSVTEAFTKVRSSLGTPSVVVYNAAVATPNDKANPLSLPLDAFTRDLNINTIAAYAAAQQAVAGFEELPQDASRTFLYTGNKLNTMTMAPLLTLGVGKSATAHVIESASIAYKDQGFKFYYCDERQADGQPVYSGVDGEAHAQHYVHLAEGGEQGPWQQTFVKGIGYKQF